MLYSALCIDNSKYFEKGTITVRIFAYYIRPNEDDSGKNLKIDDLSTNTDLIKESKHPDIPDMTNDFEAIVFAPLGGGRNYGLFALPEINEKGIVAFLDSDIHKPLWLGSYFQPIRNDKYEVEFVNIPNDQLDQEGKDTDGSKDKSSNLDGDEHTIILRTKHTGAGSGDSLNWEKVSTENIVAMDNKKVKVQHITEWDDTTPQKYQTITIDKPGDTEEIFLAVDNDKDDKHGYLKLTEGGFSVAVSKGGDTNIFEITMGDNGINFSDKYGNKITGTSSGLTIEADSSNPVTVNAKEVDLIGTNDTMVKYSDLKSIVEKLADHIHIGSVPTTPPLDASMAPLSPQLINPKLNMEAKKVKTE